MKLAVVEGEYAVCRFPPGSSPPPWLFAEGGGESGSGSGGTSGEKQKRDATATTATGNSNNEQDEHGNLHGFSYSITKTSDELSVVCRRDAIPDSVGGVSGAEAVGSGTDADAIELGWGCIKVLGPLDFGLTGILSSLAAPLAKGNIPIYAVSTYDTDYLLVKLERLKDAVRILRREGHDVAGGGIGEGGDSSSSSSSGAPKRQKKDDDCNAKSEPRCTDDPALTFEPDPLVSMLVEKRKGTERGNEEGGGCFGIVMVAGWPMNMREIEAPFNEFVNAVQGCWDDRDLPKSGTPAPAPLYFYPPEALHVTAATMVRPGPISLVPPDARHNLAEAWTSAVEAATKSPSWPDRPLELVVDSSQIGKKAGIILWKETTGGMDSIRECLRTAFEESKRTVFEELGLLSRDEAVPVNLSVPSIVHSTFLRYYSEPTTPGEAVQQRFRDTVLPKLSDFFPRPIEVPVTKLVCERTPYMHIPHDRETVFATSFLTPPTGGGSASTPVSDASSSHRFVTDSTVAEDILNRIYKDMNTS